MNTRLRWQTVLLCFLLFSVKISLVFLQNYVEKTNGRCYVTLSKATK